MFIELEKKKHFKSLNIIKFAFTWVVPYFAMGRKSKVKETFQKCFSGEIFFKNILKHLHKTEKGRERSWEFGGKF